MSEWSSRRRPWALQIVLVIFFLSATTTKAQVLKQDSLALVALYNTTNGDQWNDHTNWLQGPVSTWYGIGIVGNRVDTIYLANNGLTGSIPEAIGSLTSLKVLSLGDAGLSGALPASLQNLTELRRVDISLNIRGTIPAKLSALTKLETLIITATKLSGPIPEEIATLNNLEFLILTFNDSLKGPIPEAILGLPKLRLLVALNSKLTGSRLTTVIKNAVNLEQLWIVNSGFEGAVPDELVTLNKVTNINLDGNTFNKLPDLSPMGSLFNLIISNNQFTFEDIEPNLALRDQGRIFVYTPQKPVYHTQTITARAGSRLVLKSEVGGRANSYQWFKNGQPIGGGSASSLALNTISSDDIGNYTARITSAIVTDLTLQRNPVQLQVVKDTIYTSCDETPITLNAEVFDPLASYLWSNGETTPAVTVNVSGKYGVRIETPDYILVDTLEAVIPSKLLLGPDIDTCEPSVPISSNIVNADGYKWQTPTGTITDQRTLTATKNGRYILEVNKGTCILKDTVEVILNRFTTGSFTVTAGSVELDDNGIVLNNVALTFRNTTGTGNTVTWSFGENTSSEEEPTYTFTRAGQYEVTLNGGVDSRNCPIAVEKTITVEDLVITNAISPNGDGKNDRLFVKPFLYAAELKVVNRWGQSVYETSSYANDFTGTNLESGVYYYELYFKDIDKRFKGYVHVMKGK